MNSKKLYKLFALIVIVIFDFTIYSDCYAESEQITDDFEIGGDLYANVDGVVTFYGVKSENNEEAELFTINTKEIPLPSNFFDYREDILLRITYTKGDTEEDNKVYSCKVLNRKTKEEIENLSEETLYNLFNIESGKDVIEKNWSDNIKLSELQENVFYKYTTNSDTVKPVIENDTGKNCIVYVKEKEKYKNYEKKISMANRISLIDDQILFYGQYNAGETLGITYKSIENSELLNLIKEDNIIYLSKYEDGEQLRYSSEEYIYNDTGKDIFADIKIKGLNPPSNEERHEKVVIEKDTIWGLSQSYTEDTGMIELITISYSNPNDSGGQNNNSGQNSNGGQNSNSGQSNSGGQSGNSWQNNSSGKDEPKSNKDDTVAKSPKLPQTGTSNVVLIMIISSIVIMIINLIKLRKYNDIK